MSLYSKVIIDGTTVKDDSGSDPKKVVSWEYKKEESNPLGDCEIVCIRTIEDLITLTNNLSVEIYTSSDDVTYTRIFNGTIDKVNSSGAKITLECENNMAELVRRNVDKIYDSSIDPSAGEISEIAKDLIETYGEMTASVQSSGTADGEKIDEFKCINTDIFERLRALQEALGWALYYDDENDVVHFEPRGFEHSGVTLNTSDNIIGVPDWDTDTSHMINRLRVNGATAQTYITESGQIDVDSGYTTSSIELTKTPDNAEVLMDSSNPPTTQLTGGTKDSTTGNDYYVDRENKEIIAKTSFDSNDYAIVNYFWSAPAPIEMENSESIEDYGLFEKEIDLTDITSVEDAETRATSILSRRSVPFYNCEALVKSSVDLEVGQLVKINDQITSNAQNGEYMINEITFKYPSAAQEVRIGDKVWRMVDWQENTEHRLKRLEEQFIRNQDILRKLVQTNVTSVENFKKVVPRYRKVLVQNIGGETGIYDNENFGLYGTSKYGDSATTSFILGNEVAGVLGTSTLGSSTSEQEKHWVAQYQDTYTENFVDDDFEDTDNTTATWGSGSVSFTSGQIAESDSIDYNNGTITQAKLTSTESSGSFDYYMKATSTELLPTNQWKFNDSLTDSVGSNNGTLHVDASAYYPFNGNANDESDNSNDGTVSGPTLTTDRFGNSDKAYDFGDDAGRIELGAWDASGYSALTLSAWVYVDAFDTYHSILDNEDFDAGDRDGWTWRLNSDGKLAFNLADTITGGGAGSSTVTSADGETVSVGAWTHVVAVWNGTDMYLYIDGVKSDNSGTWSGTIPNHGEIATIGGIRKQNNFRGKIDEVLILDKALNDNEVESLYNLTNRHDLNDIYVDGKVNQSAEFYTRFVYSQLDETITMDNNKSSISFWAYIDDNVKSGGMNVMSSAIPTSGTEHIHLYQAGRTNEMFFMEPTTNNKQIHWSEDTSLSGWNHFAFTMNDATPKLYVNGVDYGEPDSSQKTVVDDFDLKRIAGSWGYGPGNYADAVSTRLDDIRIYNKTLSESEVATIYNSGSGKEVSDSYFEQVTSGTAHTFTNSGTDLRWRATENASSTGEITKLEIEDYH